VRTELRIDGANCSVCLNTTIDALRAVPGVHAVTTSNVDGCLAIEHDDVDPSHLAQTIRANLHGVATYGAELEMVSVDPLVADLHCAHRGGGRRGG
jgi:copper chaperone CopZ